MSAGNFWENSVRRREFVGACAAAALAGAAAGPSTMARAASAASEPEGVPFSLSVMLWTIYRDLPFEQRLEKVAEAGYHAVELVGEFKDWKKQDFADARRKKRELGVEFDGTTGVWQPLADASAREVFLKSLREFIPTMRELECTRLIMQTGDAVPGLSRNEMHANCIETLKRGGQIAAENNIELLIENIDPEENPKYFLTLSAEGFEIVRSVGNPRVKCLYDFFHEQIAAGNLIAKLEKNIDLVGLVHVADVPGRHDPGTGEIHYPNIFRKLAELGYSRYVAMEFMPKGETVPALSTDMFAFFRGAHPAAGYALRALNPHQNATVVAMIDQIIPETDTPGAKGARVNEFIDVILTEWANDTERKNFLDGLAGVDKKSNELFAKDFADAPPPQQLTLLRALDESAAFESAIRPPRRDDEEEDRYRQLEGNFFSVFKNITLHGYYTSEIGFTQELKLQIIPGAQHGCIPRGPGLGDA